MTNIPTWFMVSSSVVLLAILVFDIFMAFHRPHVPSTRESVLWVVLYVVLALIFAGLLWLMGDARHAGEFTAGWLTEYSLSVDNLFIFLLIMARFAVPKNQVQSMLMVGIIMALILRAIFIVAGVHLIENFSWSFYVFAGIIFVAAVHQMLPEKQAKPAESSRIELFLRKHLPMTNEYKGRKLVVLSKGRRLFTPVLIVYLTLSTTDLIFALDSIPAIFGITQNAFLIITANIFALMGLRQLYFLLGSLVDRLVYLKYGIAAILAFIAVKLTMSALHENQLPFVNSGVPLDSLPEISIEMSLIAIVSILAISVSASLIRSRVEQNNLAK